MALTQKKIDSFKKRPGLYLDGGDHGQGLYLQITKGGASWLFRYEIKDQSPTPKRKDGRRERWMGLGSLKAFTLKEARDRAKAKRQLLCDGVDPLEQKKLAKTAQALVLAKAVTFEEAAKQYFDQHEKSWRSAKHRDQFMASLRKHAFPKIGKLAVADIDTGQVLKVIEPIWPTTTVTADRVRNRIESILSWCTVRNYRQGLNPARWTGHIEHLLPAVGKIKKVKHHPALPYAEIGEFITDLHQREGTAAAPLEFTILTAARTGETLGAQWNEINFAEKIWIVPEGRIKGEVEHRVPLTDRCLEILKSVPRENGNPHVFIGLRKGSGLNEVALASFGTG